MTKHSKRFIAGTMILSLSGLIVKLINILYKLPLTNMAGLTTMGYFNTIYPTYLVLTAAMLVGIPATISKLVAEERARGNIGAAHQIFRAGLLCSVTFGLIVGIVFLLLPSYADIFAWEAEIRYVLWGLAISPVLIGVTGAIRGYFQGMQNMVPTAVSQVVENVFKVALGVGLVYLFMKRDLPGYVVISGATIGISLGMVLATGYLVWQYYRLRPHFLNVNKPKAGDGEFEEAVGTLLQRKIHTQKEVGVQKAGMYIGKILWIAVPITISMAMVSIMGFIDSTMAYHVFTAVGMAQETVRKELSSVITVQTVINVPLAISAAVSVSVLPAIAAADVHKDKAELNDKINIAFQLAAKMALPSVLGIFLLAEPILTLLYREKIDAALLQIYSICMLFMILAQSVSSILQGLSGYYKTLLAVGVAVIFKIAGIYLLAKWGLGIEALIWSSLLYFILIFGLNYYFLKRETEFTPDREKIVWKPLIASGVMGIVAWLGYRAVFTVIPKNAVAVLAAIAVAMPVYAMAVLLLKGFTAEEILILPKGKTVLGYLQKRGWVE